MLKTELMTKMDYAWYRMDTKHNLMVINVAMMFEGKPDIRTLRQTISERLAAYPRFSQRVVMQHKQPVWQEVQHFDHASHVEYRRLPRAWAQDELQQYLSSLSSVPLDKNRPLWMMSVLENPDSGFAIVFRLHHCVADGIAMMHIISQLTDELNATGAAPVQAAPAETDNIINRSLQNSAHLAAVALETGKLATLISDTRSQMKGKPGAAKQVCWSESLSLDQVKAVGKRHAATVNDVLCGAISGALRDYLDETGDAAHGGKIRAAVTLNLRDKAKAHELGNHFGLIALTMNTGLSEPLARLQQVQTSLLQLKASRQAHATHAVLSIAGHLPLPLQHLALNMFTDKGTMVISNLEGPSSERTLAGQRMTDLLFWVPQTGNIGLGMSIVSYAGKIRFGLFADQKLVRQPQRMMALCCDHFRKLAQAISHPQAQPQTVGMSLPQLAGI